MKSIRFFLILVFALLPAWINVGQVKAQSPAGVELENVSALVDFGKQIDFVATIKSSLPIRDVSILILDEAQGITRVEPLSVQPDGRTEFRYDPQQNNLRPFSPLSWNYRITLQDGSLVHSGVYSTRYDDNRFEWQSGEAGMLRVHWYGSSRDFGQAALQAAQSGLDSVGHLIPVDLSRPVDIYLYANIEDLRGTLVPGSQDWIAGHTDSSLGIVMVAVDPGPEQAVTMQQRLPHELMHIMLSRAAGDGYQNIPTWFSEGTASLAEIIPNMEYDRVLQEAVAREDWIPLQSLCGAFPANPGRAFLAYAESRSFAGYLYQAYGSQGLLKLAGAYAGGANCEDGPELAFGVPFTDLEKDWQASMAGARPSLSPKNIGPYLVLLFLILLVPILGTINTMRGKRNAHEPETNIRK